MLKHFIGWMEQQEPPIRPASTLAAGLAFLEYLDYLSFSGCERNDGSKAKAALNHVMPEVAASAYLQRRFTNALSGWGRNSPGQTRIGMPIKLFYAMVGVMLINKRIFSALAAGTAVSSYGRPGETLALTAADVNISENQAGQAVAGLVFNPTRWLKPGKTGEVDESVIIDSLEFSWVVENLGLLKGLRREQPDAPLFHPLQMEDYNRHFFEALTALKAQDLGLPPYSLRHTGASYDFITKEKKLSEIKMKGRWRSDASVRRYTKPAFMMQLEAKIDPRVLDFVNLVKMSITAVLRGKQAPPPLPKLD